MLLSLTVALVLITLSFARSLDSSIYLARHQHVAGVKRSSVRARCQERSLNSTTSASSTPLPTPTTPAASSSSSSSGSGKVGLSWTDGDSSGLKNFVTSKVSAVYNWTPVKPTDTAGLEFIPMLWGGDSGRIAEFQSVVKAGYANTVFAFNEPDLASQSNLDPETAAQLWMQLGQPLRQQGYSTIAPAVAFNASWLEAFFAACKGCEFDALAAHIYTTSSETLISYLTGLHTTFNLPLWVTEFACEDFTGGPQADESQVFAFAGAVNQWLEETDFIIKYFPYSILTASDITINSFNALMNDDSETPTALGNLYLGT